MAQQGRRLASEPSTTPAKTNAPELGLHTEITIRGGYVAAGVGLRGETGGTITINDIPGSGNVVAAYLYWGVLNFQNDENSNQLLFVDTPIQGTLIGQGEDTCWDFPASFAYRADVTAFVDGNGSYLISGISQDPFEGPFWNGATLVAIYEDASAQIRTIRLYEGNDVINDIGEQVSTFIDGFTVFPPVNAQTTFIVGDGQSFTETASLNGPNGTIGLNNSFDGSDGEFWDTDTYDVSNIISPESPSLTGTLTFSDDCLMWVAQVFAVVSDAGGPFPRIRTTPSLLNFGTVSLGQSAMLNVQISNSGTADLVVEELTFVGTAAGDYTTTVQTPFVVPPDASVGVPVTFTPSASGNRFASLEIESNAPLDPLITVELRGVGAGMGELGVAPTALDFGQVILGNTPTLSLTVSNSGNSTLNVTGIQLTGTNPDAFSTDANAFTLAPGQSRAVNVRFAPTRGGPFSATLTVVSNVGNATVSLTGTGAAPTLFVSANRLDFGTVPVGATATRTINVVNQGTAPLTLQPPAIIGGSERFTITAGGGARQLAPGATHVIEITFAPTTTSTVNGTLRILSNDPNRPQADVALAGVGIVGLSVSSSTVNFGTVRVGQTAEATITVNNLSNNPLTLTSYGLTATNVTVEPGTPVVVPANGSTTLTLRYAPNARGDDSGLLSIVSNAPGQQPLQVSITAQAVAPDLTLSTENLNFGTVTLGLSASESFTVSNTGDADLNVTVPSVLGVFRVAGSTFTLAPGTQRSIDVQFMPTTSGTQTAALQIQSDDPAQPTAQVSLSGSGMAIQVDEPEPPARNESAPVSFTLPSDFQPTTAQLFVRPVGGTYQAFPLSASANVFSGDIPASLVTERGVQYYASFSDGTRTITIPATNPADNPFQLRVVIGSFAPPFTPAPETYRMVSVPGVLNDPSVSAVLEDDLGPYDPDVYRVFRWDPAAEAYDEHPDGNVTFAPGRSNWLITRDGLPFDADGAVSTEAVTQSLTLQPGWNQIGNPFAFPVVWNGSGSVEGPRIFLGEGDYAPPASVLLPWEGYFVFNAGGGPESVPVQPVEVILSDNAAKDDAPAFLAASSYVLQLRGTLDGYGLRDQHNYLGLSVDAADGRDALDFSEPPGLGDHLGVAVLEGSTRLSGSFRPASGTGQAWEIEVASVFADEVLPRRKRARLSFTEYGVRPDGFDLVVLDLDRERAVPIDNGSFEVELDGGISKRRFRVLLGTAAFLEGAAGDVPLAPQGFALESNYPNPFNPETLIRYRLAERSRAVVEVFDALGRRVRTLLDAEQSAGPHEIRWDARDDAGQPVASGVYVARLRAGGETASLSMLLLR